MVDWLLSRQFHCLFQFEGQQNQAKGRVMVNHDVGPLIICLGKNSSLFAFPSRYLDNSSHHLAKGAFCDRRRTESATKSQSVTPQADVLLAAADVQLLTDQLLAHATMPLTLSLTTKRETVLPSLHFLERKLSNETVGDSTLTKSKSHFARSGHC